MRVILKISILCVGLLAAPVGATQLCAGGDSISLEDGWISALPPAFAVTSVGVGGTLTRNWLPDRVGHFGDLVQCGLETGGELASINLGTNDLLWEVGWVEYLSSAQNIINGLEPHFDRLVWIYGRTYETMELMCDHYDWVDCMALDEILTEEDFGPFHHPNEQGREILAAEFVRVVPEPSELALSIAAVLCVLALKLSRRLGPPREIVNGSEYAGSGVMRVGRAACAASRPASPGATTSVGMRTPFRMT